MTTSIKTIAAAIVAAIAFTAFIAAPASAMISKNELRSDISSAVGGGSNIFIQIKNGTVTLSGYFADAVDRNRALQVASNSEGVERVIDHTFQTN